MIPAFWGRHRGSRLARFRGRADELLARSKEVLVFARTSSWSGSPEALDRWAEHVAAKVQPFVAGLPGNAGALFLIDRESGSALTLTLWESESAAEVTDQNAEASRASTVAAT